MEYVINTYAAYSNNMDIRLKSSSGAMFSTLAEYILSLSGVVYGVVMSEDCYSAEFIRVDSVDDLERIRGSKYMQAKLGNTFKYVREDLHNGKVVLFTGTGCQVNGLKRFLGKEYKNLYCMDVICHGTPSAKLWHKYVEYQESKFNSKLKYVGFRCKDRKNWDGFEMKEVYENQMKIYISRYIDLYFQLFVKNVCLRPSCYECLAKRMKLSDITVADFWGIENVAPEMNDNNGISLVITRTSQGQQLFNKIQNNLTFQKVAYEDGVRDNWAEYKPYDKPAQRDKFFYDMNRMPFKKLSKKYTAEPIKLKLKTAIKQILVGTQFWKK